MNYLAPIFTEKRQCQDCYKCVRNCPAKAVRVRDGAAAVVDERCIHCGLCVGVCPNHAKKIRDDLPRVRQLVTQRPVWASIAPSWRAEWPGISAQRLVAALRHLGLAGASETALGAQQVSAHVAQLLQTQQGRVYISSACPVVVQYIQRHRAELSGHLTGLLSPMLTHAKMLRQWFGQEIGVVFIGPCVGKKTEADDHPELLDAALTFDELRRWLDEAQIRLETVSPQEGDRFEPTESSDGAIYPVDGGMIAGVKAGCSVHEAQFMAFSGLASVKRALDGLEGLVDGGGWSGEARDGEAMGLSDRPIFLELLACEGGCVNGPATRNRESTVAKRFRVLSSARYEPNTIPREPSVAIDADLRVAPSPGPTWTDQEIRQALRTVGKNSVDDELNCGGCGYDSCRELGKALLEQKAERSMCVTYMRQLAHKKANALIQKMPSAVVIVDQALRVLECNAAFVQLFASGNAAAREAPERLEGVDLATLVPFARYFSHVLKTAEDLVDKDVRHSVGGRQAFLHLSIFTIEKHHIVGGIIQDITLPAVQKEQVIRKAREVIQHNLQTVQKIAYLLGENAAESEITLNSIIDSFSPPGPEEVAHDNDWRQPYRR